MSSTSTACAVMLQPPESQSSATRARRRRQEARERIHNRVVHAIDTPRLLPDPLERPASEQRSTFSFAQLLIIAALLHGLMLAILFLATQLIGSSRVNVKPERVKVRIVETRVEPPPPPVEEVAPPPPPSPKPNIEPRPEPKREPRPKPPPQVVPRDPTVPATPTPAQEPVRRVVGLSMESVVQGGSGPAFAIGSSRMGETGPRAEDPAKAANESSAEVAPNRISTRFADPDAPIVAPRRLRPSQPLYPNLLREQGVEADVVVSVTIGPDGRVVKAEIVKPAAEQAFNDSALAAANAERYAPATRAGEAVSFTQTYTIRFRLND